MQNSFITKIINPTVRRAGKYLFFKAILIFLTILAGVFFTVVIANRSGQMEISVNKQVDRYLRSNEFRSSLANLSPEERAEKTDAARQELIEESGLNLPFWPRHLRWSWNALRFDWGRLVLSETMVMHGQARNTTEVRDIIISYFPNTLLLAAAANFLVFLFGIPLSLYLARNYGGKTDRIIAMLSPLSSIPSWAIGVVLIAIFAVELGWLPTGGMFDKLPPENQYGYILIVARRMILPVSAIFISLFFQLVGTWRTFFVLYSQEDYVDLGKAQGLSHRRLEQLYILKPALPYVITSFTMTLVGFWQMTMALEVIFKWPGIGWLYVERALPNFWGESMYPGEILLAIGVVVMFAYLLGGVVFLLDVVYVLVDPRVHLETEQISDLRRRRRAGWWKFWLRPPASPHMVASHPAPAPAIHVPAMLEGLRARMRNASLSARRALTEIRRYPSAMVGFFLLCLLVAGSLYAIIGFPYATIGREWRSGTLTGRPEVPQLAQPSWVNWLREDKYLSTLKLNDPIQKESRQVSENMDEVSLTFTFDFNYADFPSEIYLYLLPEYTEKQPYLSLLWTTPDGRSITLKGVNLASKNVRYNFLDGIPARRLIGQNPDWKTWFNFGNVLPTPLHYTLFAAPDGQTATVQKGTYTLQLDALFFNEPAPDLNAELVMLGQVYGAAGSDYFRRDLLVPLLWGMPFALAFGLFGATVTTLLSMFLAAASAWYGGWVDSLLQRLTEANMVLPVLAIGVLAYSLFGLNIWVVLAIIIALNIFGSPSKTFRSAFLQVKQAPYIEAARAYGASNRRIILDYMIPRIIPVIVPQLITLIPTFVFLEATLGIFNIKSDYPTWGTIIYQGLTRGALYGPKFWVLQPIALLLMTSLAFALLGSALERILNPRLQD
ncbi:MAG: ABC transporter permease subunit [Anaerolineae bacterium]|nr:ABC transporter permease subunit [Anaerolineae bacterium]